MAQELLGQTEFKYTLNQSSAWPYGKSLNLLYLYFFTYKMGIGQALHMTTVKVKQEDTTHRMVTVTQS